jgi:3-methyladenine DNA glycosylase AlkD
MIAATLTEMDTPRRPVRGEADAARPGHAERLARAGQLGSSLAELVGDPPAFATALRSAYAELAEPAYRIGQQRVAPGIGLTHGVRLPYQAALRRALRTATRRDPASVLILLADKLIREPELEARWLAMSILERTVLTDPERSWQLLRHAARDAADWITVDTLAHPCGKGVLRESYRWAELEQLTISPSRWERRLVGSTIATIPFVDRTAGRAPEVAATALPLLGLLMGDREPDVQKALAWAYRSLTLVDPAATTAALEAETALAVEHADGNRAWVIRDALPKLAAADAARLRARLDGIRRRAGGPSTSPAAELAERFAGMGLGRAMPEPPLT